MKLLMLLPKSSSTGTASCRIMRRHVFSLSFCGFPSRAYHIIYVCLLGFPSLCIVEGLGWKHFGHAIFSKGLNNFCRNLFLFIVVIVNAVPILGSSMEVAMAASRTRLSRRENVRGEINCPPNKQFHPSETHLSFPT